MALLSQYPTTPGVAPGPQPGYVDDPVGTLPAGSNLYNQGGPQPNPLYQHSWFNPLEQQGHNLQLMGGMQSVADAYGLRPEMRDLYGSAIGSITDTMSGGGVPPKNPHTMGAINATTDRMTQDVLQNVMPYTDLKAAGANQTGSSRHGVLQANALRQSQQAAGQAASEGLSRDYNAWLGAWGQGQRNLSSAWGTVPGLYSGMENAWLNPSQMATGVGGLIQGVGGQYRGLTDQFLQDGANQWDQRQQQPYNNLDWYSGIVGGVPGGIGTSTSQGPGTSTLGNAVGGAALGYGLYNHFGGGGASQNPWFSGANNQLMQPGMAANQGPWYNPMGA